MPSLDPPTQITLKVKVPPGYLPPSTGSSDSEQFNIGILPVTTTIGALRGQIQQLIPTHPAPDRQRILYGGRALVDNDQTVGDALNIKRDPTQEEYVVHLLVKGEGGVSRTPTPNSMMSGGHLGAGNVPIASAGSGSSAAAQPAVPNVHAQNPTNAEQQRTHVMAEQQRNVARQLELQQQIWRQHMQAHNHALSGQGLLALGQQPPAQGHGPPALVENSGQQGAPPSATQGANNNGPPQPQHLPFNQHMGPGFHVEGVGPDGQRFQIHQQTINFPAMHMPAGFPGQHIMPAPFNPLGMGLPGMPLPQQNPERQANAPTALDQARENLLEMRRMLDEMAARAQGGQNAQEQQRLREMQTRARTINEYIDPFGLHNANTSTASAATGPNVSDQPQPPRPAAAGASNEMPAWPRNLRVVPPYAHPGLMIPPPPQQMHPPTHRPGEVTAYLLSSPQGPQALLFSPEHGAYTGTAPVGSQARPTPTSSANQPNDPLRLPQLVQAANNPLAPPAALGAPADPVAQAARQQLIDGVNAQAAQAANGEADDAFGVQPILGHFWLLFRILVFAYFLLGSNMGWQRPVVLAGIGLGFWLIRMGVLGDGGMVRRWWDGIVGLQGRAPAAAGQQNAAPAGNAPPAQPVNLAANARQPMPTPEQVAQRLLNEAQEQRRGWLREQLRPVERAIALFVASLWPGIGEEYVREQRRQREEAEVEARRRAEEEGEEARKREAEAQAGNDEKDRPGEGSDLNTNIGESTAVGGELNGASTRVGD